MVSKQKDSQGQPMVKHYWKENGGPNYSKAPCLHVRSDISGVLSIPGSVGADLSNSL